MKALKAAQQIREVVKLNAAIIETADLPTSYKMTTAEADSLARVFLQEMEKKAEGSANMDHLIFLEALEGKLVSFGCLIQHREQMQEDAHLTSAQSAALKAGNMSFKYAYELIADFKHNHA
ncbi:hypothetical protein [Vibrio phage vB_ValS_PJ32]|nr:hypothetical protein [Vibrio phage vB_ValS_PJ32]